MTGAISSSRPAPVLAGEGGHLVVRDVREETSDIVSLRLEDPCRAPLPDWAPGARITVVFGSGRIEELALCGSPGDDRAYRVALPRRHTSERSDESGRRVDLGSAVRYFGPRQDLAFEDAAGFLLIAGGIGIASLVAMATELYRVKRPFHLVYQEHLAEFGFRDELESLGDRVELLVADELDRERLDELFGATDCETAVYASGPSSMLAGVAAAWPERRSRAALHLECPSSEGEELRASLSSNEFFVELARQHRLLRVPANRSILSVVAEVYSDVRFSCTHGTCGQCETGVVSGEPIHRDAWLTAQEKRANSSMMICVGRARSPMLVLDL